MRLSIHPELFLARYGRENPQLLQHACHGDTCGVAVRSPLRIPHQSQPGDEQRGREESGGAVGRGKPLTTKPREIEGLCVIGVATAAVAVLVVVSRTVPTLRHSG